MLWVNILLYFLAAHVQVIYVPRLSYKISLSLHCEP